jgi:DNA polymerase I-like protein with 3'-5' exonuclease and polymerase domains
MRKSVIKTPNEFRDWMSHCKDVFALDTETTSLNWLDLEMIGFSICDGKQACYVVLNRKNKKRMLQILDYYIGEAKMIVMHSAPYDMMVLKKEGIII